jgi:dihydroxy-acid dehydratase
VRDGDTITLDVEARTLDVDADLDARRDALVIKESRFNKGVLAKYAKLVASASEGAITR